MGAHRRHIANRRLSAGSAERGTKLPRPAFDYRRFNRIEDVVQTGSGLFRQRPHRRANRERECHAVGELLLQQQVALAQTSAKHQ